MNKEQWNESLNHIDKDLVEEFVEKRTKLEAKNKSKSLWIRLGALAACFCLLAGMLFLFSNRTPAVPVWENAMFSAQDIADIMKSDTLNATGTQAYQEVHAPSKDNLYASEVPDQKYLDIYRYNEPSLALQEQEFKDFIDSFNGKLASALGIQAPLFEIRSVRKDLIADEDAGKYSIIASQTSGHNSVLWRGDSSDRKIILDGETVQIDLRKSDSQIIESLESVKNKLFDIFGVTFKDAKVVRDHASHSEVECYIDVIFYNAAAHPLNQYAQISYTDNIRLRFDNIQNHADEVVSDSIISDVSISYNQRRNDISKDYQTIARQKRISLEEAEALLYKGYTFGGHTCELCMANNDYVSFEDYDLVGFEYLFDEKQKTGIPFYTFYKEIRELNNVKTYAKTYVPAIPVSGYKEYFESQLKNHR